MKVKNLKNPFHFWLRAKEPNRETWQILQNLLKEDLAKFGYTLGMKVKNLKNPFHFWLHARTQ
jgi:hypothetical protein